MREVAVGMCVMSTSLDNGKGIFVIRRAIGAVAALAR
jgi:hypothetical protein